jgi:transcriptional regulator of arginine metabolism
LNGVQLIEKAGGKMKAERQQEIIRIIDSNEIETQEELARHLREKGYKVTQATVSRDIKELRLIKVSGQQSTYCYARPGHRESAVSDRLIRLLSDSTTSVESAGQMIVVKTLSGSANAAAEAIDNMNWKEVLGTIAGDNTVFLVVRNGCDSSEIANRILNLVSEQ